MITTAPTNSQLAGVLAGFVFTGIIILFGRNGAANTRTLGLFCSAFIVLAFGSYLFSVISGGIDPLCQRIWSVAMAASGMLAVGGTALISGLAWLLADHARGEPLAVGERNSINLGKLSRVMVLGVAAAVTLMLGMTTFDYISVISGKRGSTTLVLVVYLLPLVVVGVAGLLGTSRISRTRALPPEGVERLPDRSLSVAVFCTLGYGIVGPLFGGGVTNIGAESLGSVSWTLLTFSVGVGFVLPVALVVLLVYAVPHIDDLNPVEEGDAVIPDEEPEAAAD